MEMKKPDYLSVNLGGNTMNSFETYQQECPCVQYKDDEILCAARGYIDLCTERFCPVMKERLDDEEPV